MVLVDVARRSHDVSDAVEQNDVVRLEVGVQPVIAGGTLTRDAAASMGQDVLRPDFREAVGIVDAAVYTALGGR